MLHLLLNSSRPIKRAITASYDLVAIPAAIYLALALRHGILFPSVNNTLLIAMGLTTGITLIGFIKLGLYRAVVRFMTARAFSTLGMGVVLSAAALAVSSFLLKAPIPRSSIIIYFFTAFALLGLPRLFIRSLISQLGSAHSESIFIYGAGEQGIALANALKTSKEFRTCAFIDDDKRKQGSQIHGLRVYAIDDIDSLLSSHDVDKIVLALGRSSISERKNVIERLADFPLEVLTAPSVTDIVSGKARIEEVRDIDIDDLLGRDSVQPNQQLMQQNITGKVVLITGAGGSIGSELCRQALLQQPKQLILFELNEFSLYRIEQELQQINDQQKLNVSLIALLGSVQQQKRLETIFKAFQVQTVFHAAAYKHVPMVEHNVIEGIRNNIFGTWFCAEAAITAGVERFVLISTDKAVRPTNVMGASKRVAELVLQALNQRQQDTTFCMVRFGNVLGSSGSVVPLFRQQIKEGGPITVTHPDIIRYFMTIPEASQLVMQAGAMGKGGDVFVLDMGEPVRITQLAQKMIRLSGLTEKSPNNPKGDIEIQFTGLRPGEKLYEELLIGDDVEGTSHPRIMTANEVCLTWPETHNLLNRLDRACHEFKVEDVIQLLKDAPAAFNHQGPSQDWVMNASKQR
ncbi:MAG: polysaccharide biosynthesis protein [Bacterioplanes sp.]|nr:polysaccharide biosynthesis protein [Bacterioplanes sp.]